MDINNLWESDVYYEKAKESSSTFDYPGMKILKKYSLNCNNILDLGCGDGTRLNYLLKNNKKCVGVDISKKAISLAQKQYPKCNFRIASLENLPFKDNSFDLVYSAFVIEHLQNPEKVIKEAIRVLKSNGIIVLMAPNYGAPNRISPPAKYPRLKKICFGFLNDLIRLFFQNKYLNWRKVTPKILKNNKDYEIDCDSTIEPYIGDLITFLKNKKLKIIMASSLWSEETKNGSVLGSILKLFGRARIYPFKYWGPHLLIVAKK